MQLPTKKKKAEKSLYVLLRDTALWLLFSFLVGGPLVSYQKNYKPPSEEDHPHPHPLSVSSFIDPSVFLIALLTSAIISLTFPYRVNEIASLLAAELHGGGGASSQKLAISTEEDTEESLRRLQAILLSLLLLLTGAGGQLDWQQYYTSYPYSTLVVYSLGYGVSVVIRRALLGRAKRRRERHQTGGAHAQYP